MSALTLSLFGPVQMAIDGRALPPFRTKKAQALLIYLATEAAAEHRRESIMTLLWGEMLVRSARLNLRQITYQVRQAIPDLSARHDEGVKHGRGQAVPLLLTDRQTIWLNPLAQVDLDVSRFTNLLQQTQAHNHLDLLTCQPSQNALRAAVAFYSGEFMADFYLEDSDLFEAWAARKRHAFRLAALDALGILTASLIRRARFAEARRYAERQLAIDHLRESAYRQLMRILALTGQGAAALALYETWRRLLETETGRLPSAVTIGVRNQILAGDLSFERRMVQVARRYELKEKIGAGSHGVVHRAVQPLIGREVAVKRVHGEFVNDLGFIRRFEGGAQTIVSLEHPNIVPLYDYWREPDGAYLVMRLLKGGNLHDSLQRGAWPVARILQMVEQICSALAVAHRQGIAHQNLKPANILLDETGTAYLSDLGITNGHPAPNGGIDTASNYMSPEQLRGERTGPRSDLYSLAVILCELLTRIRTSANGPMALRLPGQADTAVSNPDDSPPDLPGQVEAVLQRAMAERPADRYPDAQTMASAFRQAVQNDSRTG